MGLSEKAMIQIACHAQTMVPCVYVRACRIRRLHQRHQSIPANGLFCVLSQRPFDGLFYATDLKRYFGVSFFFLKKRAHALRTMHRRGPMRENAPCRNEWGGEEISTITEIRLHQGPPFLPVVRFRKKKRKRRREIFQSTRSSLHWRASYNGSPLHCVCDTPGPILFFSDRCAYLSRPR